MKRVTRPISKLRAHKVLEGLLKTMHLSSIDIENKTFSSKQVMLPQTEVFLEERRLIFIFYPRLKVKK